MSAAQTPLTPAESMLFALTELVREIREHAGIDPRAGLADLPQAIAALRRRSEALDLVVEILKTVHDSAWDGDPKRIFDDPLCQSVRMAIDNIPGAGDGWEWSAYSSQ